MAALGGLPQSDVGADIGRSGQAPGRHKGVVQGVEGQGRQRDALHQRFGRGLAPVGVGVAKAVQRRGEHVVKIPKVARTQQGVAVEQARVLRQFGHRLGHHGFEEHGRVRPAVEPSAHGMATGRQVQGRADRGHGGHRAAGLLAVLGGPSHERIAAQRDAHHQQRAAMLGLEALKYPVQLLVVARMVGPGREVHLARATSEMRHRKTPVALPGQAGKGLRVVAGRRALQAVKEHQQGRRAGLCGSGHGRVGLQPIHVDKVLIRCLPAFALPTQVTRIQTP